MKKLFAAALALVLLAFAGWIILASRDAGKTSAWVKRPDGISLRVAEVSYGTNNLFGTPLAKATARMPAPLQKFMKRMFGQRVQMARGIPTGRPQFWVWIEWRADSPPATGTPMGVCFASLSYGSNFITRSQPILPAFNMPYCPLEFGELPRREREIMLNISYSDGRGCDSLLSKIPLANPLFRKFPVWQAESLPATKRAGDLEVTISKLETGHDKWVLMSPSAADGGEVNAGTNRLIRGNYTLVRLKARSLTQTNEAWEVSSAELSDATGNRVTSRDSVYSADHTAFAFSPSLWPGEPAWKLKLRLKRTQGYHPQEIFVFKDVPLGQLDRTNVIGWSTNFGGVPITLESISGYAPPGQPGMGSSKMSQVVITRPELPPDTVLDFLGIVSDTGVTNQPITWATAGQNGNLCRYTYTFRDVPLKAKTADFIFALPEIRTVEFTLKPELPKAMGSPDKK